jgi:hypothetical protein
MMKKLLSAVALGLVLCAESHAVCTGSVNRPAQHFSVLFDKQSSELSPEQALRLRSWASDMLSKYPLHQWLLVDGEAMPNEEQPNALARRRAVEAAKLALDSGLSTAPIEIKSEVGSISNPASYESDARSSFLQLNIGCPENCCAQPTR